jgi:4-amino-4-deoxy-L-arabinose transferase-like glycosyltransferase
MNAIIAFLTDRTATARRDLTLLALVFGAAFFQFLGRFPLIEPDEGRYSEIPREMLERGDFITPLLNYVKYFEKPPLHYWLNAVSFTLFGQNEFAARFAGTLAGLVVVLFTYHLGRRLFDRQAGILAAAIMGTAGGFLVQARINYTDMTLTCCLTLCLGCFILAVRDPGPQKGRYYYLFYLFSALAVLAKGLIGIVFPGAIIFLFLLLRRRWALLKEMRLPTGILLALVVAAPWFVLVSLKNPEFPRFFFIHEHFERFLTKVHRRYQPFWYFLPILLLTMLPWSFMVPAALRNAWQERRGERGEAVVYLLIWALFIFAFFSKSSSKLIPYILPVFPPLALLVALTVQRAVACADRWFTVSAWVACSLLTLVGGGLAVYPHVVAKADLTPLGGALSGLILGMTGLLGCLYLRRRETLRLCAALGLGILLFAVAGPYFVYARMAPKRTSKELGLKLRELAGPDAVVATFGYEQTVPFYARRRVIVVGGMGELEFGSQQGDQSAWFMDPPRFYPIWDGPQQVFVVLKKEEFERLRQQTGTLGRVLAETPRRLLATNR